MQNESKPQVFVFFGPPGAGKGEQSKRLSKHHQIPHISSGELLRQECQKQTKLGLYFNEIINKGSFPPDEYIVEMIIERIQNPDCANGFILDGFPRTLNQARILDEMLQNDHEVLFVNITIDQTELITRLTGRRVCSNCAKTYHIEFLPPQEDGTCDSCSHKLIQRNDDHEEVICKRFEIFNEKFHPMVQYYQGRQNWVEVPSKGTPDVCFEALLKELASAMNPLVNI